MRIIYFLAHVNVARYGELKKEIGGITHKILTNGKRAELTTTDYHALPLGAKISAVVTILKQLCQRQLNEGETSLA